MIGNCSHTLLADLSGSDYRVGKELLWCTGPAGNGKSIGQAAVEINWTKRKSGSF